MLVLKREPFKGIDRWSDRENFVERLGRMIGHVAGAEAVFGRPVERGGHLIVPAAGVRFGFGGGGGAESGKIGRGGGGGAKISPLGFIELSERGARWRPIRRDGFGWLAIGVAAGMAIAQLVTRLGREG